MHAAYSARPCTALAAGMQHAGASAQTYPQRTVKFILPFGPASGTDITARLVGDRLSARWGKPVVIENRPGGDGLVAINAFISANDDHTLLWVPVGTFAVHPFDKDKLPYDADRDLIPIANVTSLYLALSAPASMKPQDRCANSSSWCAPIPASTTAAAANGNADFLMSGFLKNNNLDMAKVPYRDIMQGPTDLAENRIQLLSSSLAIVTPLMQAGKIKVLAVTGRKRAPSAPDVPDRPRGRISGAGDGKHRRHLRAARHAARDARADRRRRARRGRERPGIATKLEVDRPDRRCARTGGVRRRHQGDAGPARRHRQGARHESRAVNWADDAGAQPRTVLIGSETLHRADRAL